MCTVFIGYFNWMDPLYIYLFLYTDSESYAVSITIKETFAQPFGGGKFGAASSSGISKISGYLARIYCL